MAEMREVVILSFMLKNIFKIYIVGKILRDVKLKNR